MSVIKPMVDANILVYAHNLDSPLHTQAGSLLKTLMWCKTPPTVASPTR